MKKNFITIALFAVLSTLAVSCQKENIMATPSIMAEKGTVYSVTYSVDGMTYHLTLVGEDAWHAFLHHMMALAKEGHEVSFRNENASSRVISPKDVVTFTTTIETEASAWAEAMAGQGYEVTIKYDKDSGVYTCTAIK